MSDFDADLAAHQHHCNRIVITMKERMQHARAFLHTTYLEIEAETASAADSSDSLVPPAGRMRLVAALGAPKGQSSGEE